MSNWKYKLQFKHILSDEDPTDEQLKEISNQAASIISQFIQKLNKDKLMFYEFNDVAYEFENEIKSLTDFNNTLDLMYDLCDQYRVWVN